MPRFVLLAMLVTLLAACGGGGTSTYSKAKSEACLAKQGVRVGPANSDDFVANSATGGSFSATLVDNGVTVSFGLAVADATNLDQAYRRFHAKNVGINDILRDQNNAVMLWRLHPSDADLAVVTGCLKS